MKILIPMAGKGQRFIDAGYQVPKPLIEINGKPLIERVVDSLREVGGNFIFCALEEHIVKYDLYYYLNKIAPKCSIIPVPDVTQGAVNTCLLAEDLINSNEPLVISNCDQICTFNAAEINTCLFYYEGFILNFTSNEDKWSYVSTNERGYITKVAEKKVISNIANVGIYGWSSANLFFDSAKKMIEKNIRVNNEFYIAPTYNELIARGFRIKSIMCEKMYSCGVPSDLEQTVQTII